MGIAGSIVSDSFFQEYLGMRTEYIDMSEFVRRFEEQIYDPAEFEKALSWVKENCVEGPDNNPAADSNFPREEGSGLGDRCENDNNCPRLDDRQPSSCGAWLWRRSDGS